MPPLQIYLWQGTGKRDFGGDLQEIFVSLWRSEATLTVKCQTGFSMSYMEHQPISEIAEKMNISTRTVKNYITQTLMYLYASMGKLLTVNILRLSS